MILELIMKKMSFILISVVFLATFLSCNQSFESEDQCITGIDPFGSDPYGSIRSHSDCKGISGKIQNEFPSSDECIMYQYYPKERILYIAHKNSGMNCEPGKITAKISIKDDIISINENQEKNGAKCNCLYDIDYDLRNIDAKVFLLSVSGPIIDGVNIPSFSCYIDLTQHSYGTFCLNRGFYPWTE
jgi:hypothetical protein